jgi:hypothetical protein
VHACDYHVHIGPSKASSFKQEKNIKLSIQAPTGAPPAPGEEPIEAEAVPTPSAAEVEQVLEQELLKQQQQQPGVN